MKMSRTAFALVLALSTTSAFAQSDAQKSFDKLKTLVGTWEGKTSKGTAQVTFRMTGGGSALMSEINGEEDMITMFHLDGDRLLMTHYCGAGNQPRMVGTLSPDGKSVIFEFLDATNLSSPKAAHMRHVVFTFPDANHHVEDWTFAQDGKEMKESFNLERKTM